jgi:probable HAF family extracellular repeat protein
MKSYRYTSIDPPGSVPNTPGGITSDADGINDKGEVFGTYFDSAGVVHGFIYDNGSYTTIDPLGSVGTFLQDINNKGQLIGEFSLPNGGLQGFMYYHGTYTLLPFFPFRINDKGDMVGTKSDGHGYVYSDGQLSILDVPGASATNMVDINDKGQIAGVYVNNGAHGFLYDHGTFYSIDPAGSAGGGGPTIVGMNDNGEVIGRFQTTQGGFYHAFLYDNGAYTNLDFPGALSTEVFSINDKDQILGRYSDNISGHVFVYDHGIYTTIDQPPAGIGSSNEINDRGAIVGYDGNGIGFLGTLEPTSQLVQAMASFGGGSGATDLPNGGLVNADASQQPLLTTPQHA